MSEDSTDIDLEKKVKKFYDDLDDLLIKNKLTVDEVVFYLFFASVKTVFEYGGDIENSIKTIRFIFDKLDEEKK